MKKKYLLFLSVIISNLFLFDSAMGVLNEFEKKTIIDSLKNMNLNSIDDDKVNANLGDVEFGKNKKILQATPLALAINIVDKTNREKSNTVKLLLRKNADLFHKYTLIENSKASEMTPITSLAYDDDYAQELTDWFMKNKNKINEYVDSKNNTITHVFAYNDKNLETLKSFVTAGVNIEAVNKDGKTPLHIALEEITVAHKTSIRATNIAEYFLYGTSMDLTKIYTYKKTNPDAKQSTQVTESLFKTVWDAPTKELLDFAFDNIIRLKKHNKILNSSGYTLMHYLASVPDGKIYLKFAANEDDYKPLLADLNSKNNNGKTPLFLACDHNAFKNFKALLELNADINLKDNKSNTLLHAAVNSLEILTYLLIKKHSGTKSY